MSSSLRLRHFSSLGIFNRLGPSVRNLLQLYGLKAASITPSGPHNILIKGDVLQYIDKNRLKPLSLDKPKEKLEIVQPSAPQIKEPRKTKDFRPAPAPVSSYKDLELTNMRRVIAKRLTQSKISIPHAYMTYQCNANSLLKLISSFKASGAKVSLNDGIIKIAALALKQVQQVNAIWDDKSNSVQILPTIDISIAVATPTGLITPIIKLADTLSIQEISAQLRDLAERARIGKLKVNEFQGGSFSISNLGMFGISHFVAVINPPQSAILAVGCLMPFVGDNNLIEQTISVTLSYDCRVIDEEVAAKYLETFRTIIESASTDLFNDSSYRRLNDLCSQIN